LNKVILHHLGLGDHLICNGLIREILSKNSYTLHYPLKIHNYDNISFMLDDLSHRIKFIPVFNDGEMINYSKNFKEENIIKTGIFNSNWKKLTGSFCQKFYLQLGIPYKARWENFRFPENKCKKLDTKNNEKCFVHQDTKRGLTIKETYLPSSFYSPEHTLGSVSNHTIFDYINLLNDVEEIHCIDSSFACLIDHVPSLKQKKKFIHRYVRKHNDNPTYKNNWIIINE